jgi:hypothetical protein
MSARKTRLSFAVSLPRCPIHCAGPRRACSFDSGLSYAPRLGLKALLASAPLDGIDLDRSRDLGREIDL